MAQTQGFSWFSKGFSLFSVMGSHWFSSKIWVSFVVWCFDVFLWELLIFMTVWQLTWKMLCLEDGMGVSSLHSLWHWMDDLDWDDSRGHDGGMKGCHLLLPVHEGKHTLRSSTIIKQLLHKLRKTNKLPQHTHRHICGYGFLLCCKLVEFLIHWWL